MKSPPKDASACHADRCCCIRRNGTRSSARRRWCPCQGITVRRRPSVPYNAGRWREAMRGNLCLTIVALLSVTATSRAVTLYDGSLNTLPEQQGWLLYGGNAAVPTKTAGGGKTTFDSGTSTTSAGWSNTVPLVNTLFNPLFPTLDRSNGFVLGFDVKVLSEAHNDNDRAGFDVILLGSDHQG